MLCNYYVSAGNLTFNFTYLENQAADGVMVWEIFSWHVFSPLVPNELCLNTTALLSIVASRVLCDHSVPMI